MYFKSWDSNVEAKQKSGSPKGVYPSVQNCIFEIDLFGNARNLPLCLPIAVLEAARAAGRYPRARREGVPRHGGGPIPPVLKAGQPPGGSSRTKDEVPYDGCDAVGGN